MPKKSLKFTVGTLVGPHSNIWVAKVNQNDGSVYLFTTEGGKRVKLSFHPKHFCQYAETKETYGQKRDRFETWERPRCLPKGEMHGVCVVEIAVSSLALTLNAKTTKSIRRTKWILPPADGHVVIFNGIFTKEKPTELMERLPAQSLIFESKVNDQENFLISMYYTHIAKDSFEHLTMHDENKHPIRYFPGALDNCRIGPTHLTMGPVLENGCAKFIERSGFDIVDAISNSQKDAFQTTAKK